MRRTVPWLIALSCALCALPAAARAPVSPKGEYRGRTAPGHAFAMSAAGGSLVVTSFGFRCGSTVARTAIDDIPLKRMSRGYRFRIFVYSSMTYRDNRPDQNGTVTISGHFGTRAREAAGRFRAQSPRCRGNGWVRWTARRR